MAVLRPSFENEAIIKYIGTLAIFCAICCTIIMLKFKAKFHLSGKQKKEIDDIATLSVNGAYRVNREEFFGYGSLSEEPRRNITPGMVSLPSSAREPLTLNKSTSDLAQEIQNNEERMLRASTPEVVLDPRGKIENSAANKKPKTKEQEKEQKKIEKQKALLQKRKDKIIANEQAKQDKLRKELEKKEAQKQAKEAKTSKSKTKAPEMLQTTDNQPTVSNQPTASNQPKAQPRSNNPLAERVPYSMNTLESSISKSSGPPPYTEIQKPEVIENKQDKTGNTSFGKKVENDSWDLVSRHRQQMVRPTSNLGNNKPKHMILDLNFDNKATNVASNSDA